MLFAKFFPGDDKRLADKTVIDKDHIVTFFDEPDSRTLCEAGIAVEGVERNGYFHCRIEFLEFSRDALLDKGNLVAPLEELS